MKVAGIDIHRLKIPFVESFSHASKDRKFSDSVIVVARDENGCAGYGEGLPRPYVTGETVDLFVEYVSDTVWPRLKAGDFPDIESPADIMSVAPALGWDEDSKMNASICASELAVIDLNLRSRGRNLKDVLAYSADAVFYSGVNGVLTAG